MIQYRHVPQSLLGMEQQATLTAQYPSWPWKGWGGNGSWTIWTSIHHTEVNSFSFTQEMLFTPGSSCVHSSTHTILCTFTCIYGSARSAEPGSWSQFPIAVMYKLFWHISLPARLPSSSPKHIWRGGSGAGTASFHHTKVVSNTLVQEMLSASKYLSAYASTHAIFCAVTSAWHRGWSWNFVQLSLDPTQQLWYRCIHSWEASCTTGPPWYDAHLLPR